MSQCRSQIDIQGMSCANCSQTIADAVRSLDGVSDANINFATDEGSVEYDPDDISLGRIFDAIEDAGYSPVREDADSADGAKVTRERRPGRRRSGGSCG